MQMVFVFLTTGQLFRGDLLMHELVQRSVGLLVHAQHVYFQADVQEKLNCMYVLLDKAAISSYLSSPPTDLPSHLLNKVTSLYLAFLRLMYLLNCNVLCKFKFYGMFIVNGIISYRQPVSHLPVVMTIMMTTAAISTITSATTTATIIVIITIPSATTTAISFITATATTTAISTTST